MIPVLVTFVVVVLVICLTVNSIMTDSNRLRFRAEVELERLKAEASRPRYVLEDTVPGMWRVENKTESLDKKP